MKHSNRRSTVSWTPDNKGFFYNRYDEPRVNLEFQATNYFQKLYYHVIGTPQEDDELVYFRADEKEWVYEAVVTDDGAYLVIHVWNATGIEIARCYRAQLRPGA